MSTNAVSVRVMSNGVVVHRHAGANGWHDPSRNHGKMVRFGVNPDLHAEIGKVALLKADGLKDLSAEAQAQYVAALGGKTFWVYPTKKAVLTPELIAAAEAAGFTRE